MLHATEQTLFVMFARDKSKQSCIIFHATCCTIFLFYKSLLNVDSVKGPLNRRQISATSLWVALKSYELLSFIIYTSWCLIMLFYLFLEENGCATYHVGITFTTTFHSVYTKQQICQLIVTICSACSHMECCVLVVLETL